MKKRSLKEPKIEWKTKIMTHEYSKRLVCNCEEEYDCRKDLITFIESLLENSCMNAFEEGIAIGRRV